MNELYHTLFPAAGRKQKHARVDDDVSDAGRGCPFPSLLLFERGDAAAKITPRRSPPHDNDVCICADFDRGCPRGSRADERHVPRIDGPRQAVLVRDALRVAETTTRRRQRHCSAPTRVPGHRGARGARHDLDVPGLALAAFFFLARTIAAAPRGVRRHVSDAQAGV